ncbi:MAG: sigma-70 family RNA polymerase sigma factor [Saprospiraceae bacterium]|nr:sigma-70 family RNA polymerase sigma factor [Candidatus Opimibacter skivensis]
MEAEKPNHDLLLQSLSDGDMAVLDQIYDTYRDDFLRWSKSRFQSADRADLLDAWHDTMIMFYEQVRDRKLTHLTCELKSFLFLIGYRRLIRIHKAAEKTDLVDELNANIQIDESINTLESEEMDNERRTLLIQAVDELPEQSRRILMLRFVEGKSVSDIMETMGYTSVNAVSVTLSRCLKKLKDSIGERMVQQRTWKKEIRS